MAGSKVLIIGDSISIGYTPLVADRLADRFVVTHNEGNAGDSDKVRRELDHWLARDADAAIVTCNCGLHDIKLARDGTGHQVPIDRYRENLADLAARLSGIAPKVLWATTTPVLTQRHAQAKPFDRHQSDVEAYNAVAVEIMAGAGLAVVDLHQVILDAGPDRCICNDGVHMLPEGSALLAARLAEAIEER
jgi:acyl-CoA thioesterase-1